jgi:hypothetical protein
MTLAYSMYTVDDAQAEPQRVATPATKATAF